MIRRIKVVYEVEYTIRERGDWLVIEEVYKRDGKIVKETSYEYTPNEVISNVDGKEEHRLKVRDKVSLAYVKAIARHIDHPEIPETYRLHFLQRYSRPHYFNSKQGGATLRRLLNLLNLKDEIKNKQEVRDDEQSELTTINTS